MLKRYFTYAVILAAFIMSLIVVFSPIADLLGITRDFKIREGLDLQGGTQLVYQTDLAKVPAGEADESVTGVVEVIRNRIDRLGVAEPVIQKTRDNSRVIVELPGVRDIDEAISLIGQTAQLEFREGIVGKSLDESGAILPDGAADYNNWQDVGLTGANFVKAEVQFDQSQGSLVPTPVIAIEFDADGRKTFADVTGRNIGKPLAIFLDQQILSAPTVENKIDSESAVITGGFDVEEAKRLAIQLNAGALPVPVSLISQNNIGATLGTEAVEKSLVAGLLGLLLVAIFMMIYYRLPGLLAAIALGFYTLLSLSIFILLPVTLTLAGIAGFILSIGMAIDANILIFERLKEELRAGAPLSSAIDTAFRRAWSSIRDSNVSSLITAGILYYFGSGMVRGFALTLSIGILVSMFTAMTVTHLLMKTMARTRFGKRLALWSIAK